MSKPMLPEAEWSRNVGTQSFPVSFIHEYAVGLLWDALQDGGAVVVKTIDGSMSGNLKEGVDRVVIPDALQPIGGCIPDLGLLDKDMRPVRVIEVIVTSPPKPEKMEKLAQLQKRGVEVVQVPVRNEDELKALVPLADNDFGRPRWNPKWSSMVFDQMDIINFAQMEHISRVQGQADKQVKELIQALIRCRPETRRQLVKVLEELDGLESLYRLSPKNPKHMTASTDGSEE